MTSRVSKQPNLAVAVSAIIHTKDLLMVYVQRDGAPVCSHGNEIGLVQTPVDCPRKGEILQWLNLEAPCIEPECVSPICTDKETVGFAGRTISTEKDPATVAFDNRHLHLKDEVAEVAVRA